MVDKALVPAGVQPVRNELLYFKKISVMNTLDYLKPSLQTRQKRRDKRMGEEVIECYRRGCYTKNMKGYDKQFKKNDFENARRFESIKFKHGGGTKFFNDNLEPLERYLISRVGKNWDKIYSELCNKLDKSTVPGLHVFNHLFDYVYLDTFMEGKNVYHIRYGRKTGLVSDGFRPRFYINHKTGQLMKAGTWNRSLRC